MNRSFIKWSMLTLAVAVLAAPAVFPAQPIKVGIIG